MPDLSTKQGLARQLMRRFDVIIKNNEKSVYRPQLTSITAGIGYWTYMFNFERIWKKDMRLKI